MTASFWFGGFNVIPTMMEEKSSGTSYRKVGSMIVLAIAIGIVFKTGVVLSASMSMPWKELVGANIPAAAAFERAFGSVILAKLVLVTALFALLATWNAMLVCASRILFALGRAHFVPPVLGTVQVRFGSPAVAIGFSAVAAGLVTLLGRNAILPIVNASSTCLAIAYIVTCWTVIRMRRTHPALERPFRVPGGIITMWVAMASAVFSLGLSLYQPWADAKGKVPLEPVMLIVWGLIGAGAWLASGRMRQTVDAAKRRSIILGEKT
jgi:amino acid transporter